MIASPDMAMVERFADFVDWLNGHSSRGPAELLASLLDPHDCKELAKLRQLALCLNAAADEQRKQLRLHHKN